MTYPATHLSVDNVHDLPDFSPEQLSDADPQFDNNLRATFASGAVKAYAARMMKNSAEEPATAISDLLGDLRHLCDALGLDFDDLNAGAWSHYDHELRGEF